MRRAGIVLALLVAACGCGWSGGSYTPADRQVKYWARFQVDDSRINVPELGIKQGGVNVISRNSGHHPHELIFVREIPGGLPRKPDGSVDESQIPILGRIKVRVDGQSVMALGLTKGHYVVFDNLDGNFAKGMLAGFSVT